MKKFVFLSAVAGAMMLVANNASAVMGLLTITGTAQSQSYDKDNFPVIQQNSFNQKNVLFILSQATGDTSITNKPTQIYFDPDTNNTAATTWEASNDEGISPVYGIFYYSNSVSGLVRLDGTNGLGEYYSYMEFDYYNSFDQQVGHIEAFWNPEAMEYNSVATESHSQNAWTQVGNAILYIHSDPGAFNILGPAGDSEPSAFYVANNSVYPDFLQAYAVVIHGAITYKMTFSQSKGLGLTQESFTLKGSGDLDYDYSTDVFNGTATFNGKGPNE